MKLADRFQSFTAAELQRAIDMREKTIIGTRSEIKALQKLLNAKHRAIAAAAGVHIQDGGTNGEDHR